MSELFSLETIEQLARDYGYWAVFFGISLENAGVPLPGETITLVGGFLAGSGELNYGLVLASAIGGAILGDNFGYWLGVWGGWPLLKQVGRLFRISDDRLLDLKGQFARNAPRAVFFGRFATLLRIFAGPLAGIVEMPYPKFFAYNAAGAILWATTMVSLAFFVGRVVPLAELVSHVAKFGIAALLLFVAAVAVPHFFKMQIEKPSEEAGS